MGMKRCTLCLGVGLAKEGVMMSGKSTRSLANLSPAEAMESTLSAAAVVLYKVIEVKSNGSIRR